MLGSNIIPNDPKNITGDGCPKCIKKIQHLYLIVIAILPFGILLNALFRWTSINYFFEMLLNYLVYLGIYYGISRVKSWVVIFALLISYWGALRSLIAMQVQYSDIPELAGSRTINVFFLCFFVYQIVVFSRKETKEYFKVKEKIII